MPVLRLRSRRLRGPTAGSHACSDSSRHSTNFCGNRNRAAAGRRFLFRAGTVTLS
jgi:hypothetical protein